MAIEGVKLSIIDNIAIFSSGMTEQVITSKNMDELKSYQDVIDYCDAMSFRSWWPMVKCAFEREAIGFLNRF